MKFNLPNKKNGVFRGLTRMLCLMILLFTGLLGQAQLSITAVNSAQTQNFNSLASTGTALTQTGGIFAAGWSFFEGGGNANQTYNANNGADAAGNTYSYGTDATATDRAFGMLQSVPLSSILGFKFTNNTGVAVTSIAVSYTGEQWRRNTAADNLFFSYMLSNAAALNSGTWIDVSQLTFSALITGTALNIDGNLAVNQSAESYTITGLNIASGTTVTFRWLDTTAGNSAGMAIDDFSIKLNPVITVVTGSATAITATSATLNGTANANGATPTLGFQRGLTTTYGTAVASTPAAASGTSDTATTGSATGLSPNTEYHFRLVGSLGSAATNGSDVSFFTLANVPGTPVVNGATSSSLNVTLNTATQNSNPAATQFAIQTNTGSQYVQANGTLGATAVWQTASAWGTITVSGLTSSTAYAFKVKARNGAATPVETAFGATATGTTLPPSILTIGSVFTNFGNVCTNATAQGTFTVSGSNLNGTAVTVNAFSGFGYSLTTGGPYSDTLNVPYTGSTLPTRTIYVLFSPTAIQSYNGNISVTGGGSNATNVAVTGSGINTPADVIVGDTESNITSSAADLHGLYDGGCSAVTAYGFEYSTTNAFANGTGIAVSATNAVGGEYSVSLTNLNGATTYYYKAYVTDATGTYYSDQDSFATTAPATFGGISQAAPVCATELATFNVTGLLYPSTTLLTYNIAGGSSQTVSLVSDASGNSSFTRTLSAADNTQTLTVTSVQRTDVMSDLIPVSTNNIVILVSPASVIYYADSDGDTYGNPAVTQSSCTGAPEGYVADNTDCNDGDNTKHTSFDFYADSDNDGFGSGSLVSACAVDANTPPTGYSLNNTDCAPGDTTKWQSSNLFVDADADGYTTSAAPTAVCYGAAIPAGYTTTSLGVDCKDDDNTRHDSFGFYVDGDGDTYGSTSTALVCAVDANTAPAGYSVNNTDCNDGDANKFQSATLYVDGDFDGYSTNATAVVCYGASVPAGYVAAATAFDCNDAVAAINPGHTEVLYNGVDDNCDGNLDEGNQLLSNVITQQCGITLAAINSVIQVTTYPNITQYRYRVYKIVSGNPVGAPQFVERAQPYFTLTQMSTYEYAATYSIQVELQRNGTWLGYYGSACQVSTPALLDNPNGSGSINPSLCGQTLATISTLIATPSLQSATAYKFRVTNITDPLAPGQVQEIERSQNYFALTMLPYYFYGTTYNVEVSVKASGVFSGYGATCPVTSPSVPMINNCDQHMAQPVNYISTASLNKVVSYRFEISLVDANDNPATTFTLDRTLPYFSFNMVPNYVQGGKYMVRVALRTTGYHSPFGEACFVYAPVSLRQDGTMKPEVLASRFDATVFPNPYVESFSLDFDSTSEDKVQLRVYDMIGKLLEERNFETTQIELAQFGQKYPSGVYNIVLTQGGNVKTLRVIKR